MPRKPVDRSLPALESLFPKFPGFDPAVNKSAAVLNQLRDVIARTRGDQTVAFYAVRTIGQFFGVATKSVTRAYERLEAEGLLTRVRGSQTLLQGRVPAPRHPVRGVVGIPIYLPAFYYGTLGRALYLQLETELRRHHFAADFIFYRQHEETDPDLAERILEHDLDYVLWWVPGRHLASTIHRLRDAGCRLVLVSDGRAPLPAETYYYNIEGAYEKCLRNWQANGIRSVVLMRSEARISSADAAKLERVLRKLKLDCSTVFSSDASVAAHLRRLGRRSDIGVVFLRHSWYDSLCQQFPTTMERLFRAHRVLLAQGPVFHPLFSGKEIHVDSITFDCDATARRIARDISSQRAGTGTRLATFPVQWDARVDLGKVSREI